MAGELLAVIDANILVGDPNRLDSAWTKLRAAGAHIVVPQVAEIEYVAHLRRDLDARIQMLEGLEQHDGTRARSHVSRERAALVREREEIDAAVAARLAGDSIKVIEIPTDVPHEVLIRRATERRRPFDDKGGGYRDALIWMTTLQLARDHSDSTVVLVSKDVSAFGDPKGSDKLLLHPHLFAELTEAGLAERVSWAPGLHALHLPDVAVDEQSETAGIITALFYWLTTTLGDEYVADMRALGFPEGATANVRPAAILSMVTPGSPSPSGAIAFTLVALSDVDVAPLLGWVRSYATFGDIWAQRPFVYTGAARYNSASGHFFDLQVTSVEPDLSVPW